MNLDGIRILLVEDNPGDAHLLVELLRDTRAGRVKFEHVEALDAALVSLNREPFDVILLDLSLPDAQDLETVTRVHVHAPKIPIVVLTGLDDEAVAVRAVRAGAQDYLVKGHVTGELLARSIRYAAERGRAIEALERREEHYRSLIEHSLDLISILNPDGTIRYASPSHEKVLGYPLEELIGQNAFSFIHEEDVARVRSAFERADGASAVECRFRHKDGAWRVLECFGRDLTNLPGVRGVVINSRDITERKRLEEQLHHSQRLEAIGRLAGGVAHDFNNLLMVITGHSQMLLDAMQPADPAHDDLEQVVRAAERATELTRQLLAFSRRQGVRPVHVNLNLLVQDMERMLRRVLGEDIELSTVFAAGLKTVFADPGQLEQVILNIAVNARDAMPHGGRLALETANVSRSDANERALEDTGPYVSLSIRDTGSGMDPQVVSRIFEPFFTTKEHGTGLGLSTSYGIIQQSGGRIEVDSTPGVGTTFRIFLPAAETEADQHQSTPERPALGGSETILLVEDEEGVRRVVESMLKRHGYSVLSSGSTAEAMNVAQQHAGSIDLLITDLVLPGMSGRTMADYLTSQRPGMRVLYVSGYGDSSGPVPEAAFLQKPFSTDDLALKVREILQEAPSARVP